MRQPPNFCGSHKLNTGGWQLYDLSDDRSETDNVVDAHPEVARRLAAKWRAWATEANVLPFIEDRDEAEPNRPADVRAE